MPKKLIILGGVFGVLFILSVGLLYKRIPTSGDGPLFADKQSNLAKVIIDEPSRSITLEKKSNHWLITSPIEDETNDHIVDQLTGAITSFSLGSVVSEKKDKYPTFELEQGKATRIRAFGEGSEKPFLDGYLGKQAISYGTSYFRFEGKDPVYIARDFPSWILLRPAEEYRERKLIPSKTDSLQVLTVTSEKIEVALTKSSSTWTSSKSSTSVDSGLMSNLLNNLLRLEATQFADTPEDAKSAGLDKPFMTLAVETSSGPVVGKIGALKKVKKGDAPQRYAQTEGRKAILLINEAPINELLNSIKTQFK